MDSDFLCQNIITQPRLCLGLVLYLPSLSYNYYVYHEVNWVFGNWCDWSMHAGWIHNTRTPLQTIFFIYPLCLSLIIHIHSHMLSFRIQSPHCMHTILITAPLINILYTLHSCLEYTYNCMSVTNAIHEHVCLIVKSGCSHYKTIYSSQVEQIQSSSDLWQGFHYEEAIWKLTMDSKQGYVFELCWLPWPPGMHMNIKMVVQL